jgi:hypothetical protein
MWFGTWPVLAGGFRIPPQSAKLPDPQVSLWSFPIFAKNDLENLRPVLFQSMLTNPGFRSENFIQPSPFPLAVSYIMSMGN